MSKRFKYKKSPLIEVVYQINFPPVLSIEAKTPFEFQDAVRTRFSEYQEQTEQENQLLFNVQEPQNRPIFNHLQTRKLHLFTSDDGQWKLTLAKNMLSLSSLKYDHWEDMAARFVDPVKALIDIYHPSYYNRIALRYIDAIERGKLGLLDTEWCELLNSHICGCLSYAPEEKVIVRASKVEAEMQLDEVTVKLFSGIGNVDHHDGTPPAEAFILDCDYFRTGKFGEEQLTSVAASIHEKSTSFFQNAITEKLNLAMEPEDLRIEE